MGGMNEIDVPLLRRVVRYDPVSGRLFWLHRTPDMFSSGVRTPEQKCEMWNTKHAGREALATEDSRGRLQGRIFFKTYRAHRVAWALYHGEWPTEEIDHINGDHSDNRIENLRDVPRSENTKNLKTPKNNTTGHIGVYACANGKWHAAIRVDGRLIRLGSFSEFDDACAARKAAEVEHGFHKNHGRAA